MIAVRGFSLPFFFQFCYVLFFVVVSRLSGRRTPMAYCMFDIPPNRIELAVVEMHHRRLFAFHGLAGWLAGLVLW